MQNFPLLRLLERQGDWIAILIAMALPAFGAWLAWNEAAWMWLIALSFLGLIVYGFVKSYVELVRLMVDMLLPK